MFDLAMARVVYAIIYAGAFIYAGAPCSTSRRLRGSVHLRESVHLRGSVHLLKHQKPPHAERVEGVYVLALRRATRAHLRSTQKRDMAILCSGDLTRQLRANGNAPAASAPTTDAPAASLPAAERRQRMCRRRIQRSFSDYRHFIALHRIQRLYSNYPLLVGCSTPHNQRFAFSCSLKGLVFELHTNTLS
jgi:hypothetical protein